MTSNVVAWIKASEEARSNKAREAETHRANLVSEQHARNVLLHEQRVLAETARHNAAVESETRRANREREFENTRSARAQERLKSEQNVLQQRQNTISLQRMLTESADTRYQTRTNAQLRNREIGVQSYKNYNDILNTQRRMTQEYSIAQQQIESQERMKRQEITQRATEAWGKLNLEHQRLKQNWNLKLLEVGGKIAEKYFNSSGKQQPNILGY